LVESVHRVSVAVVEPSGRLVASAGDPDLVAPWRSAAKPFQTLPLLLDGAADRFGLGDRDLAIATASHSSQAIHLEAVDAFWPGSGSPRPRSPAGRIRPCRPRSPGR
jgi:L-asparaginase II